MNSDLPVFQYQKLELFHRNFLFSDWRQQHTRTESL